MKRNFFISICLAYLCVVLVACVSSASPTDNMAYLQEKNRIYWEIVSNPELINSKHDSWFEAWKDTPELRDRYIKEVIELYKNKKGE